jgi:hypothetical protein
VGFLRGSQKALTSPERRDTGWHQYPATLEADYAQGNLALPDSGLPVSLAEPAIASVVVGDGAGNVINEHGN